jgi:hypothetical protein
MEGCDRDERDKGSHRPIPGQPRDQTSEQSGGAKKCGPDGTEQNGIVNFIQLQN